MTVNDKKALDEILSVRFSKRIRDLVKQVAQARGVDESDVVRQAVHQELARLSLLSEGEKKALGLDIDRMRMP